MQQTNEVYNPNKKYARCKQAYPKGGVHLVDELVVGEILLAIAKSFGKKILDGSMVDAMKISRPARISFHKTYLEAIANDFTNTDYLKLASEESDPVRRMKYVISFFVSGYHRNSVDCMNRGPLNPVLGETFQGGKEDGTKIYCEQISHHPPISAYLIIGPKNSYRLYGTGQLDVKLSGTHIAGKRYGKTTIEFANGTQIQFTNPETRIDGIIVGARVLNLTKKVAFVDKVNQISAELDFSYEEANVVSKLAGTFTSWFHKKEKTPSDYINVDIYSYEKLSSTEIKKTLVSQGSGSWLEYLQFDNEIFWKIDQKADTWTAPDETILPSHSQFRRDALFIEKAEWEDAQIEKEKIENLQRHNEKLRIANKKTAN